jgi:solute carrier family 25 carnitine/acylcarnitine transporter 20/29
MNCGERGIPNTTTITTSAHHPQSNIYNHVNNTIMASASESAAATITTATITTTTIGKSFISPVTTEFIGGTMGGLTGVVFGHPADTIRVRLQADTGNRYRGFWHCASDTIKTERISALYKGLLPPLIGETLNNCVLFGVYGFLKPWQQMYSKRYYDELYSSDHNATTLLLDHSFDKEQYSMRKELSVIAASGAIAGLSISLIVCPTELVKIQFQNNRNIHNRESILQCVLRCQRERGSVLSGAFHGYCATIWREISFGASYFLIYETTKRALSYSQFHDTAKMDQLGVLSLLFAGGLAGTGAWAFSYPTDYIKSRVQADTSMNMRKVCKEIFIQERSLRTAYKGFVPTVLRAFPVNAVTFLAYEYVVRLLKQ